MKKSEAATAEAAAGDNGQTAVSIKRVAPIHDAPEKKGALDSQAFSLWVTPDGEDGFSFSRDRGEDHLRSGYFSLRCRSKKLGRQLTVQDVQGENLFGLDESTKPTDCEACKRRFKPRFWKVVSSKTGEAVKSWEMEGEELYEGNFYLIRSKKDNRLTVHSFCNRCIEDLRRTGLREDEHPRHTYTYEIAKWIAGRVNREQEAEIKAEAERQAKINEFASQPTYDPNA